MINYIEIKDFCENDNNIPLELIDNLTILTGDNGAGKTTLLNLIFSILNGDFANLFKSNFTSINVNLDVRKDNKENVHKIKVIKENGYLEVTYFLYKTNYKIKITRHRYNQNFFNTTYELLSPKKELEESNVIKASELSKNWIELYCGSLETLIDQHPELEFIYDIKKCLIYFPTYRRIDTDIIELLEQNYEINNEIEFGEVRKIFKDFPMQNRIVGVNDEDVDHLFKIYSDESRKMNSEGLDILLREFIEELIKGTTTRTYRMNLDIDNSLGMYDKAPEQLIDLSYNLGIKNIDEEKVKDYFDTQKNAAIEVSKNTKFKINNKSDKDEILQETFNLVLKSLTSSSQNNNLVMRLISLYDRHMKALSIQTKPYENLRRCFDEFFKGKINITFDNYTLKLSKNFSSLSTGEKQLITLLAYIALSLREKKYKPLIIIDEPELSLHISWQLKLIENLLNISDAHFILATHSPYIANNKYDNYIWQLGDIDEY